MIMETYKPSSNSNKYPLSSEIPIDHIVEIHWSLHKFAFDKYVAITKRVVWTTFIWHQSSSKPVVNNFSSLKNYGEQISFRTNFLTETEMNNYHIISYMEEYGTTNQCIWIRFQLFTNDRSINGTGVDSHQSDDSNVFQPCSILIDQKPVLEHFKIVIYYHNDLQIFWSYGLIQQLSNWDT